MAAEKYRRYAAKCLEMADQISDPSDRKAMLDMANAWLRLASQVTKFRLNEIAPAKPPRKKD